MPFLYPLLSHIMNYCLYAFVFTLPLEEAPANITGGLFLLGSLALTMLSARWLKSLDLIDYVTIGLMIAMISAAAISGFNSRFTDWGSLEHWREWISWSAIVLVPLFMLIHLRERPVAIDGVLKAALLGGVVAIIDAWVQWKWGAGGQYPQLRSLGHVNQSAMYVVALVPVIAYLWFVASSIRWRAAGIGALVLILLTLEPMRSVIAAAVVAALLIGYITCYAWLLQSSTRAFLVFALSMIGSVLIFYVLVILDSALMAESVARVTNADGNGFWSKRDELLNSALLVVQQFPLFGGGLSTFGSVVAPSELANLLNTNGLHYIADADLFSSSHGHSVFTNTLVERGWLGLVSLTLYFVWFSALSGRFVFFGRGGSERISAVLLASAVLTIITGGIGNTTFHNEHGQLMSITLICFYLLMRLQRTTNPSDTRRSA